MKHIAIILFAFLSLTQAKPGTFITKEAKINLFSKAPLEDINANSTKGMSVYNSVTGDVAFSVAIRSFVFEKSLMQEHFNENYMESEKFPQASFKGKIQDKVDVSKDGTYPVSATGELEVHGVKQNRTIKGTITVKGGMVILDSEFTVMCKDHNIDIPKLVFQKIAESIKVTVSATYTPYSK